jgi:tRNA (guanine37-N1)-methyltransferase
VLVADAGAAGLVGYTLTVLPLTADEAPDAEDVAAVVTARPAAELSKVYVRQAFQGSGVAGALLDATVAEAATRAVDDHRLAALWLGTNRANRRAQRSYSRRGFVVVGTRRFRVGESLEEDLVMVCDLRPAAGPDATPGAGVGQTTPSR